MDVDTELNPLNALCFNAPLAFSGYQFAANNRFQHFTEELDQQLSELIASDFPQLTKNLFKFHSLDLVNFKEVIFWFNKAIQNQECPNYIYDILYSHLEDVIHSNTYLEVTADQAVLLESSGFIPMALGQTFAGFAKFYESLNAVKLLGDFDQLLQRTKEVTLLVGALDYYEQKMVEVEYNRDDNLRIVGDKTKCPFCLKELKKHDPQSYLVKSHVLSIREFHDPIVDGVVRMLSVTSECPGSGQPSVEWDDQFIMSAIVKHQSILLLLGRVLNEANQRKRLRSARSAHKYIKSRHDELLRYYHYYKKKAS